MRSHSMETMVSSQKKPHGGGLPGSLSGGISHNSTEVTKTTFSVSAHRLGSPRPLWGRGVFTQPWARRVEEGELDDRGKLRLHEGDPRPCPLKWSLHSRQHLGPAQTRSLLLSCSLGFLDNWASPLGPTL